MGETHARVGEPRGPEHHIGRVGSQAGGRHLFRSRLVADCCCYFCVRDPAHGVGKAKRAFPANRAVATLAGGLSIAGGAIATSLAATACITMNTDVFSVEVAILLPIAGVLLLLANLLVIGTALQWAQRHRLLLGVSHQ